MKKYILICVASTVPFAQLPAATLYVSMESTNAVPPYTNWASAANTIQPAVQAAAPGDVIMVSDGFYAPIVVDRAVHLRSVYGPSSTIIDGGGTNRCAWLTNGVSMTGFWLTHGRADTAAGVLCASTSVYLTNCAVRFNNASSDGSPPPVAIVGGVLRGTLHNCSISFNVAELGVGGAFESVLYGCALIGNSGGGARLSVLSNCTLERNSGGGVYLSILTNCVVRSNTAEVGGGASFSYLYDCLVVSNTATSSGMGGGGVYYSTNYNCEISYNQSYNLGGGAQSSTLVNCRLFGNSAVFAGGGVLSGRMTNCLVVGNSSSGRGGGVDSTAIYNCTIVGNWAQDFGGAFANGAYNSIVYYNIASNGLHNLGGPKQSACCAFPTGMITNEPVFLDAAAGDYRLASTSPCRNVGYNSNNPSLLDLAGNARVVGGVIDLGAYEFQGTNSADFYDWLGGNGVPPDGSTDYLDSDGDGRNNWQEWVCGSSPTNSRSALRLLSAAPEGADVLVSWKSVAGKRYFVERASNLGAASPFQTIATGCVARTGTTCYRDTNAAASAPVYYRVGVSDPSAAAQLAHEWKLEGNTSDTSGNGNHGVVTGNPVYVAGKFGQAIYLNAADSIQKTNATGLPAAGDESWSCNVWLYLTNSPALLAYLAGFGDISSVAPSGTARGLLAFGDLDLPGVYSWGADYDLASGLSFPLNRWTMITITHDALTSTRRIWVDGQCVASKVTPALANAPAIVSVGVSVWNAEWQGMLDEFTVWAGVLSTNNIAALYSSNHL